MNYEDESKIINSHLTLDELWAKTLLLSDMTWYHYLFLQDPVAGKFSISEKNDLIQKAAACGCHYARKYAKYQTPARLAKHLDTEVHYPEQDESGGRTLFAQYTEPNKIEIFINCINELEKNQIMSQQYPDRETIIDVLMSHELFHRIEYIKHDTIFTQTYKKLLWKIGPIKNHSSLICLSEIAAMSFAKHFLKLNFNPCCFNVLLTYSYHQQAAVDLYGYVAGCI